jgi:Winged helix-turn-helix DNA-binding
MFILAKKEQSTPLLLCSWGFVLLTLATLFDLFVLRLQGPAFNALMFARCSVGVSYSILFRMISHVQQAGINNSTSEKQASLNEASQKQACITSASSAQAVTQADTEQACINESFSKRASINEVKPTSEADNASSFSKQASNDAPGFSKQASINDDNEAHVQQYRAMHPEATQKEIAETLGISRSTVQRYDSKSEQSIRLVK